MEILAIYNLDIVGRLSCFTRQTALVLRLFRERFSEVLVHGAQRKTFA